MKSLVPTYKNHKQLLYENIMSNISKSIKSILMESGTSATQNVAIDWANEIVDNKNSDTKLIAIADLLISYQDAYENDCRDIFYNVGSKLFTNRGQFVYTYENIKQIIRDDVNLYDSDILNDYLDKFFLLGKNADKMENRYLDWAKNYYKIVTNSDSESLNYELKFKQELQVYKNAIGKLGYDQRENVIAGSFNMLCDYCRNQERRYHNALAEIAGEFRNYGMLKTVDTAVREYVKSNKGPADYNFVKHILNDSDLEFTCMLIGMAASQELWNR